MTGDGVALHSMPHPEDTELVDFARSRLDDADQMIRRLASAYLAVSGELQNPDAVETVEIDLPMPPILDAQVVEIDYTNWKDERRAREIMPISIRFGSTEWHPDEQWLLLARDVERNEDREFAMDAIHSWSR